MSCLQLKFYECFKEQDATAFEGEECDEGIVQNQQIFGFVDVPSFVSLFTCNPADLLYFVKGNEKRTAIKDMRDPYNHFIHTTELLFKGNHSKLTRSQSSNNKKIQNPFDLCIIPPPDDIYDTCAEINNDLQLT